ncbi:MAG TPA: RDD family protein [Solirubrobacteraceae bacterium]|nr:RDD family protein [Solirubrobacteraceae bacterium]
MSSRERLRASDADRERAVSLLHHAATEGRLDAEELDERLERAFAAKTYGELDTLVEDLPVTVGTAAAVPARPARAGWWPRVGAFLIDGLIVGLLAGVLSAAVHGDLGGGLVLLVSAAYFTILEGGRGGAGVGKRMLGLRVVDRNSGGPLGYPRAFLRWFTLVLTATVFFIGYLWMLVDPERQCWHDKLAGDLVVPAGGRLDGGPGSPPRRRLV